MQTLPWIVALVALLLLASALGAWAWQTGKRRRLKALPTEWDLAARPVFSADERRVYRTLREALPHYVLLSKLPLVRFCQPTDPNDVRYWYDLLGNSHVSFAICSANGRVLAAIDLDSERNSSRRVAQMKQAALGACRVRYLRCAVDHLPSVAELQLLVPTPVNPAPVRSAAAPIADIPRPRPAAAPRRPTPTSLWQDSTVFQDSFFPSDTSPGELDPSGFDPYVSGPAPGASSGFAASFSGRRRFDTRSDFGAVHESREDDPADDEAIESGATRGPRIFHRPRR